MKVGDRVRTVTNGGYMSPELQAGQIGVVEEVGDGDCIEVRLDNDYCGETWTYYPDELELIQ